MRICCAAKALAVDKSHPSRTLLHWEVKKSRKQSSTNSRGFFEPKSSRGAAGDLLVVDSIRNDSMMINDDQRVMDKYQPFPMQAVSTVFLSKQIICSIRSKTGLVKWSHEDAHRETSSHLNGLHWHGFTTQGANIPS